MKILIEIATILIGLTSGAMLLIGISLVPGWQSMNPAEFTNWFIVNAPLIGGLMMPISITATLVILLITGLAVWKNNPSKYWFIVASICTIVMVIMFPLYFKDTNSLLVTTGSLNSTEITETLILWQRMHWLRMTAGIIAFTCMLRANIQKQLLK